MVQSSLVAKTVGYGFENPVHRGPPVLCFGPRGVSLTRQKGLCPEGCPALYRNPLRVNDWRAFCSRISTGVAP